MSNPQAVATAVPPGLLDSTSSETTWRAAASPETGRVVALRVWLSRITHRRGLAFARRHSGAARRWFDFSTRLAPAFGPMHRDFVELLKEGPDRWEAVRTARRFVARFPDTAIAWLLLGEASLAVYRQQDALTAFEQALAIEERPDAALAAAGIYRRLGRPADAAARFARAHAAGAGPEALLENARSLHAAGDARAAEAALALWAAQVPGGFKRLREVRSSFEARGPTAARA